MMSLNNPTTPRVTIPDFVYAGSNPTSPLAYLDYVRANRIKNNIDGDREMFQAAGHGADGEHSGLFLAGDAEYISAFLFRLAGDYSHFQARRMVKLDCGADGVKYAVVDLVYAAGGYTYFQLKRPLATANLSAVYFGIQDMQALPEDLFWGAWHAESETNVFTEVPELYNLYTSPEFNLAAGITRIKAQGTFYNLGATPVAIYLQRPAGEFTWVTVKQFRLNTITSGFGTSGSSRVQVYAALNSICRAFSFWIG